MQFKKSAVVGVLITLYLSTDSWCHYIPDKKTTANKRNEPSGKIQICGNALTTLIIEACDGIVGSLNQANLGQNSVQTKITEDCCDQQCPLEYLQNYCGQTPLFITNKSKGKLLEKLGLSPGPSRNTVDRQDRRKKKKSSSEVNRNNQNNINRPWPSIEIGTISPEIDQFGGQPIVVIKKNKINTI